MGRKSSLAWHFRPERTDRITKKHGAIAKEAGIAPSHLSAVLKGRRPANERLVAAILDACPGAKQKDLFQERIGDEVPGKRTTDWRDEAETLRRELRLYDRTDVDVDFVGTDGS